MLETMKRTMDSKASGSCPAHGILVVDDEPVLRTTFKHILEGEGYRVWVGKDGREGLRMLEEKRPALVITDMIMPVVDGFDMIARLRVEHPELPIIAMSAFVDPARMKQPLECGAFCYLTKPVDMQVLLDLIRAILEPVREPVADLNDTESPCAPTRETDGMSNSVLSRSAHSEEDLQSKHQSKGTANYP